MYLRGRCFSAVLLYNESKTNKGDVMKQLIKNVCLYVMGMREDRVYYSDRNFYSMRMGASLDNDKIWGIVSFARVSSDKTCAEVALQSDLYDNGYKIFRVFVECFSDMSVDELVKNIIADYKLEEKVKIDLKPDEIFVGGHFFTKKYMRSMQLKDGYLTIEHAHGGGREPLLFIGRGCEYTMSSLVENGRESKTHDADSALAQIQTWWLRGNEMAHC